MPVVAGGGAYTLPTAAFAPAAHAIFPVYPLEMFQAGAMVGHAYPQMPVFPGGWWVWAVGGRPHARPPLCSRCRTGMGNWRRLPHSYYMAPMPPTGAAAANGLSASSALLPGVAMPAAAAPPAPRAPRKAPLATTPAASTGVAAAAAAQPPLPPVRPRSAYQLFCARPPAACFSADTPLPTGAGPAAA